MQLPMTICKLRKSDPCCKFSQYLNGNMLLLSTSINKTIICTILNLNLKVHQLIYLYNFIINWFIVIQIFIIFIHFSLDGTKNRFFYCINWKYKRICSLFQIQIPRRYDHMATKLLISDQSCDLQVFRKQSTLISIVNGHQPLTLLLSAEMW